MNKGGLGKYFFDHYDNIGKYVYFENTNQYTGCWNTTTLKKWI